MGIVFRRIGGRIVPILQKGSKEIHLPASKQETAILKNVVESIPKIRERVRAGNRIAARNTKMTQIHGKIIGRQVATMLARLKKKDK